MTENLYEILGLTKSATEADIKKQYRVLTKKYHPDQAGNTPENVEMFSKVQKAYEILSDPIQRALYDNPVSMPTSKKGMRIHRKTWRGNRDAVHHKEPQRTASGRTRERWQKPENDVSLDDLFGKGNKKNSETNAKKQKSATDYAAEAARSVMGEGPDGDSDNYENTPHPKNQNVYQSDMASRGEDIELDINIDPDLARRGGSVTLEYMRLVRNDNLQRVPYEDLVIVYIAPNTKDGEIIHMERRGHMGEHGGPTGDLYCHVTITEDSVGERSPQNNSQPSSSQHNSSQQESPNVQAPERTLQSKGVVDLPITISEAVLGGRIAMNTPMGRVVLVIPPKSSSGKQLRVRGKGEEGSDLIVELKIIVPQNMDEESLRLIEEFARRNPIVPNR